MLGPAQKKRKIYNPQARTVRDDLLAADNPILEGYDCQDPYGGQDPYDESIKLLATAGDARNRYIYRICAIGRNWSKLPPHHWTKQFGATKRLACDRLGLS